MPTLRIAIPAMDELDFLPATLDALSKQDSRLPFEVYVCVNQPDEYWNNPERKTVCEIADGRSVECAVRDVADSSAIPFSRKVIEGMAALAEEQGIIYKVMDSGAVHDTAMLAPFTDAGMIFVPSINGRSHVPEEDTDEDDLVRGAQFLMDYILRSQSSH